MSIAAQAQGALAELDKALAEKPHHEGHTFTAAVRHLCAVRDQITARPRGDDLREQWLEHVNAVITVVLAGHFPLGKVPWDELEKGRDWLQQLVTGTADASRPGA